jgi:uncharacterized membrane protein
MMTFGLLLLSYIVRAINLCKGISGDEGALLVYSQRSLGELSLLMKKTLNYPPLSFLLMHIWMSLGKSEVWARLYFVFFGVGCCWIIYLIAKELFGRQVGRLALFFAAISPFLIWISQYIRSYIDATFWALLSTYILMVIAGGRAKRYSYIFYAAACCAAIYTSYFNFLILASQAIFILFLRDRRKILKLFASLACAGILFLPWLGTAAGQYSNCSGTKAFWNMKGLRWGGLYVGRYVRQLIVLAGFDPDFFNLGLPRVDPLVLRLGGLVLLGLAVYFICRAAKGVALLTRRNGYPGHALILFMLLPVMLANIAEALFNFRPYGKLFSYSHGIWLIFMAAVIYQFRARAKFFYLLVAAVSVLYLVRLPFVYQPEAQTKKAYLYLQEKMQGKEAVLMVRNNNHYFAGSPLPVVTLINYFSQDPVSGDYAAISREGLAVLAEAKNRYRGFWFYKNYGNDEILGGNRLIENWLTANGYVQVQRTHFKRIEIIKLEKP